MPSAPSPAARLPDGLLRVTAANPSPMTHHGTNSYILGTTELCVIDPGPDLPDHLAALLRAIAGRPVRRIVVTHSHLDHSALAPRLSDRVKAPVAGFGPSDSGRSAVMRRLAEAGLAGGGEGIDQGFTPDIALRDGDEIGGGMGKGWRLRVIHTPGHMGNHICLRWGRWLFSGDHAMGWASSLISPPDGDMADYLASCTRLLEEGPLALLPGHGDAVPDGAARLRALIAHRRAREARILAALAEGPADIPNLTARLYHDTSPALRPAARRNVLAHLVDLTERNLTTPLPQLSAEATYRLT
jgi:glyoxylase-like metal-dependent hydrolase (beta-lactamase superfamily II)